MRTIEYAMIDSTIVRAHQHSAGAQKKDDESQAIGRGSKGGLSTKIQSGLSTRCGQSAWTSS